MNQAWPALGQLASCLQQTIPGSKELASLPSHSQSKSAVGACRAQRDPSTALAALQPLCHVAPGRSALLAAMRWRVSGCVRAQEGGGENESVAVQVQRLIQQATSHENLCQSYIGWCPFW